MYNNNNKTFSKTYQKMVQRIYKFIQNKTNNLNIDMTCLNLHEHIRIVKQTKKIVLVLFRKESINSK